jgi:transcriptional regulator with XRE-family HTH domain
MQNKPEVERVAANVRAELARRGISQTALAVKLQKSQPFIARRLSGRVALDVADLAGIAAILDMSMSELVAA